MSFQGHIENGMVVFDEEVSLPDGTRVRVDPLTSPKEPDASKPITADTDHPRTFQQMAQAWKNISRKIPDDDAPLSVDPDDYPLF
jgi:hypothetical protein